jgi:hypothetical protein
MLLREVRSNVDLAMGALAPTLVLSLGGGVRGAKIAAGLLLVAAIAFVAMLATPLVMHCSGKQ